MNNMIIYRYLDDDDDDVYDKDEHVHVYDDTEYIQVPKWFLTFNGLHSF